MVCIHIHVKNTNTRIYMFTKKKRQYRQHNPDEASIHIGSGVLPIILLRTR